MRVSMRMFMRVSIRVTRLITNFSKTNDLFTSLKVDMFGGDGSKVVIGICNDD